MDISVNRSFKSRLKDAYQLFINSSNGDSMTKIKMNKLVECMKNSASKVTRECVLNGWRSMLNKRQEI